MLKHDALDEKIGYEIAEHEPQEEAEKRTKDGGGTQINFLSMTAALPLDDNEIFRITSAANLISAHVRETSRYQIGTMCIKETKTSHSIRNNLW